MKRRKAMRIHRHLLDVFGYDSIPNPNTAAGAAYWEEFYFAMQASPSILRIAREVFIECLFGKKGEDVERCPDVYGEVE